jgi:hypothetical protein
VGTASAVSAADGGAADSGTAGNDVEPVYPIEPNAPADPVAQKLCTGLTELPEKKRAACCNATPGIVLTAECTRTLSAALRSKALAITAADADACLAAFDKTLDGCDWVGPFAPGPPAACQGIVKGLLAEGKKCRSSLECAGSLRCRGVGPTTPGTCAPPKPNGELCGGSVDSLATYVRQNDLDAQHPECATGKCIKHRCADAVAEGGECQVTKDCQDGLQCLPGTASHPAAKGEPPKPSRTCAKKPLPTEGEACPGGACADPLQCILNKCTSRKAGGAACTSDFECRGGCLRSDGGTKGTCGPRCDLR